MTALWCRLYAPPAMPWVTSIAVPSIVDMLKACWSCQRLNRLPDIGLIWHDWERLARKTLAIIDVPPSRHGIGRCLNPLCGVELSAEVGAVSLIVRCAATLIAWSMCDWVSCGSASNRAGRSRRGSVLSCCANAGSSAA